MNARPLSLDFGAAPSGPAPSVLMVSKDAGFSEVMRARLPDAAGAIRRVESCKEALACAEDGRIRLVIVDDTLADVPPDHLVRLLRALRQDVPIVFLTWAPTPLQERDARRSGAVLYGPKGDWDLLRNALRHFVSDPRTHGPGGPTRSAAPDKEGA